jgi:hypothetical protein
LNSDGYISYEQTEEENNTMFSFSDSGFLMQDKEGNKIESKKEGTNNYVIINNHLKVKK